MSFTVRGDYGEDNTKVIESENYRAIIEHRPGTRWHVSVEDGDGVAVWSDSFKSRWQAEYAARESLRAHETRVVVEP